MLKITYRYLPTNNSEIPSGTLLYKQTGEQHYQDGVIDCWFDYSLVENDPLTFEFVSAEVI